MSDPRCCPECGRTFHCGSNSTSGHCWCIDYPPIMPVDPSASCRCPDCLTKAISEKIDETLAKLSHSEALQLANSQAPSPRLIEHIDFTIENGNHVFSKWYLLKQRNCCGNGCRNCPYPNPA